MYQYAYIYMYIQVALGKRATILTDLVNEAPFRAANAASCLVCVCVCDSESKTETECEHLPRLLSVKWCVI